ncbi:MAG: hypothetical protein A2V98_07025 [Planctomycetes bacterium RBG_16_64_12]|nr:MAG: hypothetical protein A2V98_07025 [Planctomycetes bacterium RBG_16_64_12]
MSDPEAALLKVGRLNPDGTSKWDALVRAVAEAGLREAMSKRPVEALLSSGRSEIEEAIGVRVAAALARYGTGFTMEAIRLGDVHPPLEVVSAFREVAGAREDKEAKINTAEAYQYEREAMGRGRAEQKLLAAEAAGRDRTVKAQGLADRFVAVAEAQAQAPELTRLRLYLETIERTLAGRKKIIVDHPPEGARRQLFLGRPGVMGTLPPPPSETTQEQENVEVQRYPGP